MLYYILLACNSATPPDTAQPIERRTTPTISYIRTEVICEGGYFAWTPPTEPIVSLSMVATRYEPTGEASVWDRTEWLQGARIDLPTSPILCMEDEEAWIVVGVWQG